MAIPATEIHAALANNVLRLILMPTEACNFRCTYCYEDFENERMSAAVVRGVKRFLTRRSVDLEMLTLSWFGGEPLLAPDIVDEVMEHARSLAAAQPGLHVASDITTNGFLLDAARVARLLDLGVGTFQVSLDGPAAVHDRTRVRTGGGATFQRIWENLLAMTAVQRPFIVVVRLHVHGANVNTLPDYLEAHARAFGGDRRFRLLFKEVAPLGGPGDAHFPFLGASQRAAIVGALRARARALGILCVETDQAEICYAARGNAFVVRANGRLNKCTVALGQPANDVGCIHEDGRLELAGAAMHAWMRGLWSANEAALVCPLRGLETTSTGAGGPNLGVELRKEVPAAGGSRL